ncbi:UNVERIFIED_CONTAM: hypothetical protein Sangu_3194400, partial [Sesamum angustifolium]
GVGNAPTQRILNRARKQHHLDFLAIMEPMVPLDGRFMAWRLGFLDVVSNCGNQIWFFWGPDVRCQAFGGHAQLLHIRLESNKWPKPLFVTAVYAKCDTVERRALWDALRAPFQLVLPLGLLCSCKCRICREPVHLVAHLELSQSDHRGLLVEAECSVEQKVSSFRFQHMWTTHFEFLGVVCRNWRYPTSGGSKRQMRHDQDPCDHTLVERNRCSAELVRVCPEETFWRQKAGIRWAKDGERNTRYFHSLVQKRRFRGTIFGIQHEGEYLTDPIAIKDSAVSFFQRLLTAEPVFPEEMDSEHLEDGLTDEDRRFLCVMPTLEEVREAVFNIDPDSVAGPDGFGAVFFHTCWEIIAEDVFGVVTEFFRGGKMPKGFTATTISLIPKTASPTCWSEYRPISLCNVTNKICMKLMTTRLGHVLQKVISLSQSGFVPGRLLSDNVLLAQELIHTLESHRPDANVVFKLDMAKAYDRVSWEFLYQVLQRKGFPQCWIGLVANAISHCWFSILVNGEHAGFFHSTRGLRQGDPLLPALFVLAADYLSRGLERLFAAHTMMFYQAPSLIRVSHLAYVDYLMIFTTTSLQNMELLHDFLRAYERVSGQLINDSKSCFIVGRQASSLQTQAVQDVLGYQLKHLPITYLGVPLYKGNRKACLFDPIISRLRDLLQGWAMRNLSHGGRIPVDARMQQKGFSVPSKCQCCEAEETVSHLFIESAAVQGVWQHFAAIFGLCLCDTGSLTHMRNAAKYRGVPFSTDSIILEVQLHLRTLYAARTLTSTQWKGDLHRAAIMGFIFSQQVPRAPSIVRWHAPSPSWFKLNTEGSSLGNPGLAGAQVSLGIRQAMYILRISLHWAQGPVCWQSSQPSGGGWSLP